MDSPKHVNDPRILRALVSISLSPAVSASVLAGSVTLSVSWFKHLFRDQTGTPLRRYLGNQRLQRAAKLLEETEMPVKEVAYHVGYRHPSSFVRAFHKQFTKTPELYRQLDRQLKMLTESVSS